MLESPSFSSITLPAWGPLGDNYFSNHSFYFVFISFLCDCFFLGYFSHSILTSRKQIVNLIINTSCLFIHLSWGNVKILPNWFAKLLKDLFSPLTVQVLNLNVQNQSCGTYCQPTRLDFFTKSKNPIYLIIHDRMILKTFQSIKGCFMLRF